MSKTHDIFLLMLNLSQLNQPNQIINIFIGGMQGVWPELNLSYEKTPREASPTVIPMTTLRSQQGGIRVREGLDSLDPEDQILFRNAVRMLAVVLENSEQAAVLSQEKQLLDQQIQQHSFELVEKTSELETIDRVLSLQTAKLEEAEEEREYFFNLSPDLLCITDLDGCFRQLNPAWTQLLGWEQEELLGRHWTDFIHPDDVEKSKEIRLSLLQGKETQKFHNRYLRKEGDYRWISWSGRPSVKKELGFFVGRDITDTKRFQEKLRHADKMRLVGQLAGGIAHDFNNQLTGIMGYAELLRDYLEENLTLSTYANNILESAQRSSQLTAQLLAYGRKGKYQSIRLNFHKIISEVSSFLSRSINKNIRITQKLRARPAETIGDPSQLHNVLLNLAINARDAMKDGGELTFITDTVRLDKEYCRQSSFSLEPGYFLTITVQDTGVGIDPEDKLRIFEPFFTTKAQGKSAGMGLSAVYGTIVNHKGAIEVVSDIGVGTSIKIFLPLAITKEKIVTIITPPPQSRGKQSTILIVDDEEIVRSMISDMLTLLGYKVKVASDGRKAIDLYKQQWPNIDCVLIDMIMPNIGGKETYLAMRDINPDLKAILSTGFNIDENDQEILGAGVKAFLQKPYNLSKLSSVISETLQSPIEA